MDEAARARLQIQLLSVFAEELRAHALTMDEALLALEADHEDDGFDTAAFARFLRAAHSLKGSARAVGLLSLESLAHALEEVVTRLRADGFATRDTAYATLYGAVDAFKEAQRRLSANESVESGPWTVAETALRAVLMDAPQAASRSAPRAASPSALQTGSIPLPIEGTHSAPARGAAVGPAPGSEPSSSTPSDAKPVRAPQEKPTTQPAAMRAPTETPKDLPQEAPKSFLPIREPSWVRVPTTRLVHLATSASDLSTLLWRAQELVRVDAHTRSPGLGAVLDRCEALAREIGEESRRLRLVPVEEVFTGLRRLARDVAKTTGKEIAFEANGAEVELERALMDKLVDPLRHLVRNAIDHGIDAVADRLARGKPSRGRVEVRATVRGESVEVAVSDDGRGLDLEALAEKAHTLGLPVPDDPAGRAHLVFQPGLSTAHHVTTLSGRGVGLDVVKSLVDELHGVIEVRTTAGAGTTFFLRLPNSLSSLRVLRVSAGGTHWHFASSNVERLLRVRPGAFARSEGGLALPLPSEPPLPVFPLAHVVGWRGPSFRGGSGGATQFPLVSLRSATRRVGFLVDAFLDEGKVLLEAPPSRLAAIPLLAGATVLPSGAVVSLLSAAELIRLAVEGGLGAFDPEPYLRVQRSPSAAAAPQSTAYPIPGPAAVFPAAQAARFGGYDPAGEDPNPAPSAPPASQASTPRVLVVDDSITTRTLHRGLLEEAGYVVETAVDGDDALRVLSEGSYSLVASDVDMPGLDGVSLTRAIRAGRAGLSNAPLPVVLVSSRDDPIARARALEGGADAYVTKSTVGRGDLLDTIAQLLRGAQRGPSAAGVFRPGAEAFRADGASLSAAARPVLEVERPGGPP